MHGRISLARQTLREQILVVYLEIVFGFCRTGGDWAMALKPATQRRCPVAAIRPITYLLGSFLALFPFMR